MGNEKIYKKLDELLDERIGTKGTPDRDQFEFEVNMEVIGAKVRELRKQLSWTQSDLGNAVGVNKTRISKIESGDYNIKVSNILKLFDAMGMEARITLSKKKQAVPS